MGKQTMMMRLMRIVEATTSIDDLAVALAAVTTQLGFQHFALCHHVDAVAAGGHVIRLHNYPAQWVDY
ncbi:MAG TPA: autoinducer binding domain-containing protein, partial [Acetobacteraceae bacterium]|nr:autoinducer binding domain-containing protein [Acetobacteraceae bacterium]